METARQRASRLYYESHRAQISEKRKEWYKNNRQIAIERIKAYQAKKKGTPEPRIKTDGPIKVSFD